MQNHPGNDILSKRFLAGFMKEEGLYLRETLCTDTTDIISFDHTFKAAANTDFLREDNVWAPQYDSLFIGMHKKGQVVTWQLTKGIAFMKIEPLLSELCDRATQQQQHIDAVYMMNVASREIKYNLYLEQTCQSSWMLFMQYRESPKHYTFSINRRRLQKLRLVFRKDGDSGEKHISHTPSPPVMLQKLEQD